MATHCLSAMEMSDCGIQEGFQQLGKGLTTVGEGLTGLFVSQIYDSGREGTEWNALKLDIADKAVIEVYVWLFDRRQEGEEELQGAELREWYERQKGNARYSAQYHSNYRSMLLYGAGGGRYARLAVEIQPGYGRDTLFTGYELSFPKESFTQYLPVIYRDEPALERFLAVQQNIYLELEKAIDALAEQMDYELASSWQTARMARWMGFDELASKKGPLEADILRELLRAGVALTAGKGTPAYYIRLTEILTGCRAVMVEQPEKAEALVLVLGEPVGNWEKCQRWLRKNTPLGIHIDFVALKRTERMDGQCFLDRTSYLSEYESALLPEGCPIERQRLL
ncbi:MAG: hypothetical protein NC543_10085 [bacterium]|nr:hypothetical protein [bacterium]MCM1374335.1 hypothetical protein [Muribaculum sp.]